MTKAEIFFNRPVNTNVDSEVLQGSSQSLKNGYFKIEGKNSNLITRPGLTAGGTKDVPAFSEVHGSKIINAEAWDSAGSFVIISDTGWVYQVRGSAPTFNGKSASFNMREISVPISGNEHGTFANNGRYMAIARGGPIYWIDNNNYTLYSVTDVNAPTSVTHLAYLNTYLLANNAGTGQFHYASFTPGTTPSVWSALDVFNAESNPDNILALHVFRGVINLFGAQTIEFWDNDGISPFRRIKGATIQKGLMSKYALCEEGGVVYFFDHNRKLNILDGFSLTTLDTNYDFQIQNFVTVDDCRMEPFSISGKRFIMCIFEKENKTLVYDVGLGYFAEWTYNDSKSGRESRFMGNCSVYYRPYGIYFFGGAFTNLLYRFDEDVFTDERNPIQLELITGNIDHGDFSSRKISHSLTLIVKSGIVQYLQVTDGQYEYVPKLMIGYRDGLNQIDFRGFRSISLAKVTNVHYTGLTPTQITTKIQGYGSPETRSIKSIFGLGSYYSRQYKITYNGTVKLTIGKVLEEYTQNAY